MKRAAVAITIALFLFCALTVLQRAVSARSSARTSQAPLIVLESSDGPLNQGALAKAIAFSPSDARLLYAVEGSANQIMVRENQSKSGESIKSFPSQNADSITVGADGNIYAVDSGSNYVRVMNAAGESLRTVPVAKAYAVGALSNGKLVVASSAGDDRIHLYGPTGATRFSVGEMKLFDNKSRQQNRFLNRGKIAIGPSDTIYFVSSFAPTPTVQKYSSDGQLISEFAVSGEAVDFQLKIANDFLRERKSSLIGGFGIVTSATVDPSTGHLWISMNGTSKTGVVYEYDTNGVKLREYAFVLKGDSAYTGIITGVKDLVVRNNWIYLLTWDGLVYRFSLNNTVSVQPRGVKNQAGTPSLGVRFRSYFASAPASSVNPLDAFDLPCPQAQAPTCTAQCLPNSSPESVDCGAEVMRHSGGDRLVNLNCSSDSGGCSATGNFCNTTTGVTASVGPVQLGCNPPPPPPPGDSGGGCTQGCPEDTVCYDGLCSYCTPILVDVSGSGIRLTGTADGVDFDFNRDRQMDRISWIAAGSDNAWLVLDRNGNGLIDDGTELFGNLTPQPMSANPNGFAALAEYDRPENGGNGDGRIDRRDAIFSSLRLWQDLNHNGISEPGEMKALPSLGVKAFDVDFRQSRRVDEFGNEFRYRAKVYYRNGGNVSKWAWDVYLRKAK